MEKITKEQMQELLKAFVQSDEMVKNNSRLNPGPIGNTFIPSSKW